ncbi:MAG TPA: response regulator [Gemmatimonadaceae bacterium]|nr:response regulator [Gemmatimonadaceae bacterium]
MTSPYPVSSRPWRLGIVDDDDAVLRSLSRMLVACGYDVSTFESADEFLAAVKTDVPDALLLDLCMPGTDGLSLIDQLHDRGYMLPMVFLSGHADVPTSVRAIRAGAVDFLEKPCDEATLLASLERALDLARNQANGSDQVVQTRWLSLTPREREVVRHVVQGQLNKQIAAALGTTEKTVKVHRGRAMAKMAAKSVAELVRLVDRLDGQPAERSTARAWT